MVKSADVQMVSEDVTIRPICGVSATSHSVEFRCTFFLKNLSATPSQIQVGFPLDGESHGPPPPPSDGTDEVLSYHFIARDANNTYHVRYVPNDLQGKYARIFLWDMEFAANETKTLHVGYILPMSVAASTTRKVSDTDKGPHRPQYEKPWHVRTEACIVVFFSYVTETGRSWAGPIEKATFRFSNNTFEHCLRQFPEYVGGNAADLPAGTKVPDKESSSASVGPMAGEGFVFGMKLGAVYRRILLDGWKPAYIPEVPAGRPKPPYEPDGIAWNFDNYKPGTPLDFAYYLLGFPETVADCDPWVRCVLGKAPAKSDVLELREIAAAFFGVAPHTASVKHLVEAQVWYEPRSKLSESELSEARRAVLERLRTIADGHNGVGLERGRTAGGNVGLTSSANPGEKVSGPESRVER
jgi:hypothetical protein